MKTNYFHSSLLLLYIFLASFLASYSPLVAGATASETPGSAAVYKLPKFYKDKLLYVVSDTKLSQGQAKAFAKIVQDALEFDIDLFSWQSLRSELTKPYCVAVLTPVYLEKHFGTDFMGGALEHDLFAVHTTYKEDKAFYGVVAHELSHTLVGKLFGDFKQRSIGWSRVWGEGLALNVGKRYRLKMQKALYPSGHIYVNKNDEVLTAGDARWVFRHEALVEIGNYKLSKADDNKWESLVYPVGQQFIEFIRVHINGKGCPDAITRIGEVIVDMAKTHRKFGVEFNEKFGVDLDVAQKQFCEHLAKTQTDPVQRFAGTIFEPNRGRPNM